MEVQVCLSEWTYINFCHASYSVTYLYTAVTELCLDVNWWQWYWYEIVSMQLVDVGSVNCVAAFCVEAKNGSSRSECSKEIELWCDDCSDLSAQHGLHKDWTWFRWWSALTILQWNPAGWYQARRATSVDKFPTNWGWQWCELSMCLLLTACSSCQCICF